MADPTVKRRRATADRWLGNLTTCFLLEAGWSFRIEVSRFNLGGKPGWRLPLAFAENLALEEGESRFYEPADPRYGEEVALTRENRRCLGGPIDRALTALGAREGDLAFFWARGSRYGLVLRRAAEVKSAHPVERLLWACGLDPNEAANQADPWTRAARALGGRSGGLEEVRSRLLARGDETLLALVEEAQHGRASLRYDEPWPEGWATRMPMTTDASVFGLLGGDGSSRAAVGVTDASGQPPPGLDLSEGGLLWVRGAVAVDEFDLKALVSDITTGLVPSGLRTNWVRWMRAEHGARRSSLLGLDWEISVSDGRWWTRTIPFDDLVDALETVSVDSAEVAKLPAESVRAAYPRSALAFARAVEGSKVGGLDCLRANRRHGFEARFRDGSVHTGSCLLDVL